MLPGLGWISAYAVEWHRGDDVRTPRIEIHKLPRGSISAYTGAGSKDVKMAIGAAGDRDQDLRSQRSIASRALSVIIGRRRARHLALEPMWWNAP
jgi:hypothetical protein